jgi:HK97 gp10 family phage protein
MAGRFSIKVRKNDVSRIARVLPEATGVIIRRNLESAADKARAIVPVDTGALRDSIRAEMTGQTEGRLSAGGGGVDYAVYVHEGTSRMSARPFLAQAMDHQRGEFESDMRSIEGLLR